MTQWRRIDLFVEPGADGRMQWELTASPGAKCERPRTSTGVDTHWLLSWLQGSANYKARRSIYAV